MVGSRWLGPDRTRESLGDEYILLKPVSSGLYWSIRGHTIFTSSAWSIAACVGEDNDGSLWMKFDVDDRMLLPLVVFSDRKGSLVHATDRKRAE